MYRCFTLTYPNGFHKYLVEACRLTKDDSLTGLPCYPSQRTGRWTRTDESFRVHRQLFHTGLVAQDTAFGTLAARVDGQDSQLSTLLQHMQAEHINRSALSCTRHTADADTHGFSGIRQTLLNDLLGYGLMLGLGTFHQSHRLTKHRHITLHNAINILIHRKFAATDFLTQL